MKHLAFVALILVGCAPKQQQPNPCADFYAKSAASSEAHMEKFGCPPCPCSCVEGQIECASCPPCESFSKSDDVSEAIEAWSSPPPLDDGTRTEGMYVVTPHASVCPTRELAKANECGNSVESYDDGLRFKRGERVAVVGDAPLDGFWRAVRFTKMGLLAGWVDAERVATLPDLTHVEAFRKQYPDALVVTSDQLRVASEAPSPDDPDYKVPLEPTVFLTSIQGVETALVTGECFGVQDEHFLPFPWSHHNCLRYADCDELEYVCRNEGYCDEVVFALQDREPFEVGGKMIPAKTVVALADRVDTFTIIEDCQR